MRIGPGICEHPVPYHLIDSADRPLPERLVQRLSAGEGTEAIATHFVRCHGRATGAPNWASVDPVVAPETVCRDERATDYCD